MLIPLRVLKYSFCFLMSALFILPNDGLSQRRPGGGMLFGRGPRTMGMEYDYFDISGAHQALLTMSTGGGMDFMRLSSMNLAGGFRFGAGDSTTFRWRAGLLDADLARKFLSLGGTVLDYNKTGTLERDFIYVNLRFGPALRLGNPNFAIFARLTGAVGRSEIVIGETNYPNAGLDEETELSGFEYGYKGGITLAFKRRYRLSAEYKERKLDALPKLQFKTMSVGAQVRLGREMFGGMNLFLRFEREEFSSQEDGFEQAGNRIQVGLQILPSRWRPPRGEPEDE